MSSRPWPSVSGHHGVVVGIDGSPTSRVAVDWAARDAELRDVPLTVVHVMSTVVIGAWGDFPMSPEFWKSRDRRAEELVREALGWVADAISESPRIEVRHQVLPAAVVPTLVDMSKDADLVVVGCRGLGGVQNLLLGSVSSALVHHARCPVAVIHDEDPLMPDFANAPVAVGIDGSPASELAVAIAFEEASRRGVDLVAVHVWSDHTDDFVDGYWANLGDWAAGRVERAPRRVDGAVSGRHRAPGGEEGSAGAGIAGTVGEGAAAGRGQPRPRGLRRAAARFGEFLGGACRSDAGDRGASVVTDDGAAPQDHGITRPVWGPSTGRWCRCSGAEVIAQVPPRSSARRRMFASPLLRSFSGGIP